MPKTRNIEPFITRTSLDVDTNEEKLNRLLQDLAWEAVIEHPLSGVRLNAKR